MRFLIVICSLYHLCAAQNATIAAMTKVFPTASKSLIKQYVDQINQEPNIYDKPNSCWNAFNDIGPMADTLKCQDFVWYLDSVKKFVTFVFQGLPKKGTFTAFKAAELKTLWWNIYNQKANNFTTTSVEFLKKAEKLVVPEKFCDLANQMRDLINSFETAFSMSASDLFKLRL